MLELCYALLALVQLSPHLSIFGMILAVLAVYAIVIILYYNNIILWLWSQFCAPVLQRKCEQYWPDNVHETYDPPETTFIVSFEEVQPFADYEIKKLVVTNVS